MNAKLTVKWDGNSTTPNSPMFVSLVDENGNGCDFYFDEGRKITEVVDWQDGNGLLAHGYDESAAKRRAQEAIDEAVA